VPPFGEAVLEATSLEAVAAKDLECLGGEDAVGAAAVGDDLGTPGQVGETLF
jgi:hypothetical protein